MSLQRPWKLETRFFHNLSSKWRHGIARDISFRNGPLSSVVPHATSGCLQPCMRYPPPTVFFFFLGGGGGLSERQTLSLRQKLKSAAINLVIAHHFKLHWMFCIVTNIKWPPQEDRHYKVSSLHFCLTLNITFRGQKLTQAAETSIAPIGRTPAFSHVV